MSGNPMRWQCEARGCFNRKKRPKIEVFHECFPRGINFGDVDMVVEIGGQLLFGEWKPSASPIGRGQRLLHDALVEAGATVIIIAGDAEVMTITEYTVRSKHLPGGKDRTVRPATLEDLKQQIAKWAQWADHQSHRRVAA